MAKKTEVFRPAPSLNQLTVIDLHPAKTYHVRMFAANIVGQSIASNVLTVTTREAGMATSCLTFLGGGGWGGVCLFLTEALPL